MNGLDCIPVTNTFELDFAHDLLWGRVVYGPLADAVHAIWETLQSS